MVLHRAVCSLSPAGVASVALVAEVGRTAGTAPFLSPPFISPSLSRSCTALSANWSHLR